MTGNPGKLQNLKSYSGNDGVIVGNGEILPITHVGDTKINTQPNPINLKNVLLVSDIIKDLLSIGQLTTDLPDSVVFISGGCFIKDMRTGQIIATGSREEGLYALDDAKFALFSRGFRKVTEDKWHQRLGHPNHQIVQFLHTKNLISWSHK